MPESCDKILKQLASPFRNYEDMGTFGLYKDGTKVCDNPEILFARRDAADVMKAADEIAAKYASPEKKNAKPVEAEEKPEITIDDFAKISFSTAVVTNCEKIEKSKKLLKLTLKVGDETRIVASGIAEYYKPEELLGKTVVLVANLKPAKLSFLNFSIFSQFVTQQRRRNR